MAFPAFLDTCVLYPAHLCHTLLRLADAEAFRPLWLADVMEELRRSLVKRDLSVEQVDRRIGQMTGSFPDAMVTGYESLINGMTNHPKDRHVLAGAVRAHAEVLVTFNLADFPRTALDPYDIVAVHPDEFLLDQLDLYPGLTLQVLHRQAAAYPPRTEVRAGPSGSARAGGLAALRRGSPPSPLGRRGQLPGRGAPEGYREPEAAGGQ